MTERRSAAAAVGWAAISLVGFGASLSLITAGKTVGYQHYLGPTQLLTKPASVLFLAAQALLVAFALRPHAARLYARARTMLPGPRLPMLAALMVGSSAVVGHDLARFAAELVLSSLLQLLFVATVALAVLALPSDSMARLGARFDALLGEDVLADDRLRPRVDGFALRTAIAVTCVCLLLAVLVYQRHPHVPDEVAYLFQARTFASGRLSLPNPPVAGAFEPFLITSGAMGWHSPVPPGWAVALVPGVLLGVPWVVNPLLTGLNVILLYLVLQPMYGRRTARLATLLFALSPWNLFLGMSFMPHALTLACALAAALGLAAARRTDQARWAWLGGAALGVIASIRQLDAMIAALALGLWAIGAGGRRVKWSSTMGLVLGSIATAVPLFAFNWHFTGRPGTFPMMAYVDAQFGKGRNDYGFGANRGMGWALDPNPGHGPVDGLINAALNTAATQVELFGWCTGSLLLVFAFVLRGRLTQADRAMLGVIAITWLAYFFNYFSGGPDFGARYWFLMIVPLVVLTARGALTIGGHRVLAGMALLSLGALLVFMPWRAIDKYRGFRGMRPDLRAMATERGFGRGLVLLSGSPNPDYASAFALNPLDLHDDAPVYAMRTTAAADRLLQAFADRPVWLVDGPSVTGSGYVVRAGPLTAADALQRLLAE